MDIGRITTKEIRRALEHIRQARPLDDNPLLGADLVAARLRKEGLTDTLESRAWALAGLLETLVLDHLKLAREVAQVEPGPAPVASVEEARARIATDFSAAQPDLEAWSSLYHRYFSPVDVQVAELAAFGRPGARHGRKYVDRRIERGLRMLAGLLRELELAADHTRAGRAVAMPGERSAGEVGPPAAHSNLPARLSRFLGREQELASLAEQLAGTRLVTLTGAAGAGKTRLAVELAARLMERHPAGTWFVALGGLTDPGLVAQALADALGVGESERHAPLAAVTDALGEGHALVVLDNCEHLVEASALAVDAILRACPAVRFLATSREPLGVEGEQVWPVPPLPVPPVRARGSVDDVSAYAGVQLFVDRARAADPAFRLGDDNARAVAELCARLDGLPLALELAAVRVRMMPPADILARLDERFTLLDRGRRTADPRQRTLWAAIDWSHALLSPAEQVLLRRLSVFRDGWTAAAAAAVCADRRLAAGESTLGLGQLVDKSLVAPAPAGTAGQARYEMLESIREFARVKRRDAGEYEDGRRRHLAWCLALAEEANEALTGPDQSRWLATLALEAENLRQALDWGATEGPSAEDGLRLAALLTPFWRLRGRPGEGRRWIERLLARPAAADASALRARALDGAGALAFQQGDYTAARAFHSESLAIHRQLGDSDRVAESLRHLGNVADETGDYAAAVCYYDEALRIWQAAGNEWGVAATLNNLGLVALRQGHYDLAEARLGDSLARFRALGTDWAVAVTLSNLGDTALARGDGKTARRCMADSLTLARQLDDHEGIAYALTGMAHAECILGHYPAARRLLGESLIVVERMGSKLGLAEWLEVAALLVSACGRAEAAVQVHAAVGALRAAIDSPLPPKDRPVKDRSLAALRAELGEAEFESLWLLGTTLRGQDAAALAMSVAAGAR